MSDTALLQAILSEIIEIRDVLNTMKRQQGITEICECGITSGYQKNKVEP